MHRALLPTKYQPPNSLNLVLTLLLLYAWLVALSIPFSTFSLACASWLVSYLALLFFPHFANPLLVLRFAARGLISKIQFLKWTGFLLVGGVAGSILCYSATNILPPEQVETASGWLRLAVGQITGSALLVCFIERIGQKDNIFKTKYVVCGCMAAIQLAVISVINKHAQLNPAVTVGMAACSFFARGVVSWTTFIRLGAQGVGLAIGLLLRK